MLRVGLFAESDAASAAAAAAVDATAAVDPVETVGEKATVVGDRIHP